MQQNAKTKMQLKKKIGLEQTFNKTFCFTDILYCFKPIGRMDELYLKNDDGWMDRWTNYLKMTMD